MAVHQAVRRIITEYEARELHAARSGREVFLALAAVAADSRATSLDGLAADLDANVDALLEAMPAYAPPLNVLHQVYSTVELACSAHDPVEALRSAIQSSAQSYQDWAGHSRSRIAACGSSLIPDGGVVFTFTLSETVLHTLIEARKMGRSFRAIVTESRPNNDGLLTARALAQEGVDVEVGIDGNIGELVPRADVMLAGAEAILSDGSAVCKAGTYPSAIVASRNRVPVYVLVDSMKLHASSLSGAALWLDPIREGDLLQGEAIRGPQVCGHLFDRTPPGLLTAFVTEKGLIHPGQASQVMLQMPVSSAISARLMQ